MHIDQKAANRHILSTNYSFYGLIIRMIQNIASFLFISEKATCLHS